MPWWPILPALAGIGLAVFAVTGRVLRWRARRAAARTELHHEE